MPRDLADVLHHFLPELEVDPGSDDGVAPAAWAADRTRETSRVAAKRIIAVPVGEHDVVRAAFLWNLAIEIARTGATTTLLAPARSSADADSTAAPWPERERGILGCHTLTAAAADLKELASSAEHAAASQPTQARPSAVLVRVPPDWLQAPAASDAHTLLDWCLFLCSPDSRDLSDTFRSIERVAHAAPSARLGVTVHGARRVADAETAFRRLAGASEKRLGRELASYGMLVDDLHVYRAIVGQRPIGLAHPQSPAALALGDVARLIVEDLETPAASPADG